MTTEADEIERIVLGTFGDRSAARNVAAGDDSYSAPAWSRLVELGLIGASLPVEKGGAGAELSDALAVVTALARLVAPVPIVSATLAAHALAAGSGTRAHTLLGDLLAGRRRVGLCLSAATAGCVEIKEDDGRLSGEIADGFDVAASEILLVPADGRWWAVDASDEAVTLEVRPGFDVSRPLARIILDGAKAEPVSGWPLEQAAALGWLLLAAEASGVATAALELARDYALQRTQFGEQIGRFQAIKHKLADMLIARESARSAVFGAARSSRDGHFDIQACRLAKAVATASATAVAAEAIQVHGAIGCTWEHDLHLLLRRAKACQLVFGSVDEHYDALAAGLLAQQGSADRRDAAPSFESELTLQDEDAAFLAEFRAWLDDHLDADRLKVIRYGGYAARQAWQAELAEGNWCGIHWPVQYGGRDASFIQQILYHSELAARNVPRLIGNRGLSLVGPTLIVHGSDEQRSRFLEATRRADILWASGLSEPSSGSDLASLRTRGVVDGEDLVITGQKIWTTAAQIADYVFTLVRTGPSKPKHGGISVVLIPKTATGVDVRPIRRLDGPAEFNEVFFDEVRVPLTNVVGVLNEGWKVAKTTLSHEHMTNFLGAQLRQAKFVERLIGDLYRREEQTGRIDAGLRSRLARSWANTLLLRLHGLRNITRMVEGGQPGPEGSIMKLFGGEEERRLFELAFDMKGADALLNERAGRNYLGARAATIGGGTSEIHRNKLAERVLGMPRDPWADDDVPAG